MAHSDKKTKKVSREKAWSSFEDDDSDSASVQSLKEHHS